VIEEKIPLVDWLPVQGHPPHWENPGQGIELGLSN
jgi:hypothetical protein